MVCFFQVYMVGLQIMWVAFPSVPWIEDNSPTVQFNEYV